MGERKITCGIYALLSREGECLWIGQSVGIERRFRKHCRQLESETHRKKFVEWFLSQDKDLTALRIEILEECEPELLNEREGFWFEKMTPRFYGQIPSESRKWFLSDEAKANISAGNKKATARMKAEGTFLSGYERWIASGGIEAATNHMRSIAFNSETASAAGRKGAGRPKSEEQKLRQSEAARANSANVLECSECGKPCKGKSALGAHKRTHRDSLAVA